MGISSIINFILQEETPGPFLNTAHTAIFSINRDEVMIWSYHPLPSILLLILSLSTITPPNFYINQQQGHQGAKNLVLPLKSESLFLAKKTSSPTLQEVDSELASGCWAMAGFSHLPQQMEYGLTNAGSFLFCHGNPEDAAASLEASSAVLDSPPMATASPEKKRKPREDTASLNFAQCPKVAYIQD
jgi:hypothetical protein